MPIRGVPGVAEGPEVDEGGDGGGGGGGGWGSGDCMEPGILRIQRSPVRMSPVSIPQMRTREAGKTISCICSLAGIRTTVELTRR